MHFVVVGLNHKTADVDIREKCYFAVDKLPEAYERLNAYESVKGSVILSTCNRVEIYASVESVKHGFEEIEDFISTFHEIPKDRLESVLYKKNCQHAVMHLFKVSSSIDSMVVGEYQIQGQVRDAYSIANHLNTTDGYINKLFQSAINIGKRVRTETEIGKGSVSVATLAVELIKQVFDHREKFHVLLVGAGKMAGLTAQNLQELNTCYIKVTNRSYEKAIELSSEYNGSAVHFEERYEALKESDIIIVSTGADKYTIEAQDVKKYMDTHPFRSKIFIDLSIPRNIDPDINEIENCIVYSIDDINKQIHLNVSKREQEVEKAEKILEEVSEEYYNWYYKQIILPTMFEIKDKLDVLKLRTLATYKSEFGSLTEFQQRLMKEMLDAYSDKLISVIMKNIKNSTSKEDLISIAETLRHSFSVEEALNEDDKHQHPHPHSHHRHR